MVVHLNLKSGCGCFPMCQVQYLHPSLPLQISAHVSQSITLSDIFSPTLPLNMEYSGHPTSSVPSSSFPSIMSWPLKIRHIILSASLLSFAFSLIKAHLDLPQSEGLKDIQLSNWTFELFHFCLQGKYCGSNWPTKFSLK